MQVVKDYETFQSCLWQNPIEHDDGVNDDVPCEQAVSTGCGPQFSPAAAALLNTQIPITLFARVAESRTFPADLHRRIAPSAWARAALLGQNDVAAQVAKAAGDAEPALKPYLQQYAKAQSPEEHRFAAVFAILHFPDCDPMWTDPIRGSPHFRKLTAYVTTGGPKNRAAITEVGSRPILTRFRLGFRPY